jgi:hypothetical protein
LPERQLRASLAERGRTPCRSPLPDDAFPPANRYRRCDRHAWIRSIGNLGGLIGPTAFGWARALTGSFTGGLHAVAAFAAMSAVVAGAMAEPFTPISADGRGRVIANSTQSGAVHDPYDAGQVNGLSAPIGARTHANSRRTGTLGRRVLITAFAAPDLRPR